ncbi:myb-like protein X isoform X2 [Copidosoma floridanum]|uniref:myb-like protein X isoform X2 n=1 Tax=Copidosoma floridanum TaxID=29053 RepID=UPI0006C95783|nr:myb-like protein X isoform X2 [Copidosoma floridanum]
MTVASFRLIELFLVKSVTLVVTDRNDKSTKSSCSPGTTASTPTTPASVTASTLRSRWADTSGGSGGPPSLMSLEAPTPTTPTTPYRSVEGPLSNSTNQRGSATQRSKSRADAMLERALTQPQQCSVDPLNNAQKWAIPIWTIHEFYSWFGKVEKAAKSPLETKQSGTSKQVKVKHLKEPFIKFESYRRETRPVFVELKSWPTLNFDGEPGSCPFDLKRREKKEVLCANKEIKENREKCFNPDLSKGKDMTRRPCATATRARKTENTGHCEICRIDYKNLSKHLQTDQHLNFVRNDKNFLSLDNLISTGASVEAFLKINISKDVSKDCSLFSSRDSSLENGLSLPDEKWGKKDKSSLSEYSVEDIRMMQCNGARKNSKLDSAHNLRTRAKHESGHLLRSKGKPLDENAKSDKPSEKFIITKRAKGTIWIEEDDSETEKDENELVNYDGKPLFSKTCESESKSNESDSEDPKNVSLNGVINIETVECKYVGSSHSKVTNKDSAFKDSLLDASVKTKVNGYEEKDKATQPVEVVDGADCNVKKDVNNVDEHIDSISNAVNSVNNNEKVLALDNEDTNSVKSLNKDDRGRFKVAKRGGRTYRGRQRLSVEERLIEDNRDYYKVEVLGNKLRSSAIPISNQLAVSPSKENQTEQAKPEEGDKPSSEKPVVVRFKRVRKSELSLLSVEAESFMFGDPRRDDNFSDESDGEQSSILPKDTESDGEEAVDSIVLSSSQESNITPKQEFIEDDSQDSPASKARKKRRTQTEALLKDNTDYYKFETPGSRLRYQAPLTGICDPELDGGDPELDPNSSIVPIKEKIYPSKPSAEVEKMHYSFEAVPKSEPWYRTYERQDKGDEYYYSESDSLKPFLLPYEIENFHEILQKNLAQSGAHRKRGRNRGGHLNMGVRSPRKSPRCHASTLAIMSTIIRRREQQTTTLNTIDEEGKKANNETAKPDKKSSEKSDVDEDLKQLAQNIDNMLSDGVDELEQLVADQPKNIEESILPEARQKGAPADLLEILEHVGTLNGFENSSCASSECGELRGDSLLKTRKKKKRKNKTGWPGNKMRRKMHIKNLTEELQKELQKELQIKESDFENRSVEEAEESKPSNDEREEEEEDEEVTQETQSLPEEEIYESEQETGKENEPVLNLPVEKEDNESRESIEYKDISQEASGTEEVDDKSVLKQVSSEEVTPRKKRTESPDKCIVKEVEIESQAVKDLRYAENKSLASSEDSEASLSNNENLCSKDTNALVPHEKRSPVKFKRKRQRKNTTSSETSNHVEVENRRQSSVTSSSKKQKQDSNETRELTLSTGSRSKKMVKKLKHNDKTLSNENCKEDFLSVNERRRPKRPRKKDSLASELQNGEFEQSGRVSPSSDVDQRRSSIDFQPVVRVMKIDHSVDMDNSSVLSVTVASNRRLRSSASSPKSNMQPPKKRFKNTSSRRYISGLGMKNS